MRWVLTLLLVAALAGCTGSPVQNVREAGSEGGDDPDGSPPPPPPPGPTSPPPIGPLNRAPTASLSASGLAGEIPFNVTFDVDGGDEDGDGLSWTLDLGDGASEEGDSLPATVSHTYLEAGRFVANLTVSDGQENATQSLVLNVTQAASGPAPFQEVQGEWASGTVLVGCFGDVVFGMPNYPDQADGVLFDKFPVDPLTIGQPFTVEITSSGAADSPGFTFLDAQGGIVATSFLPFEGLVPEGSTTGVFWVCAGGPMEGTYVAGTPPA